VGSFPSKLLSEHLFLIKNCMIKFMNFKKADHLLDRIFTKFTTLIQGVYVISLKTSYSRNSVWNIYKYVQCLWVSSSPCPIDICKLLQLIGQGLWDTLSIHREGIQMFMGHPVQLYIHREGIQNEYFSFLHFACISLINYQQ